MTVLLFVLAAVAAVADWAAVWQRRPRFEFVLKPAVLALLVAAAATADLGRWASWTIAALVLGLLGDIALLFTRDRRPDADPDRSEPDIAFLLGLGAFLLGHLAYLVAFVLVHEHTVHLIAGVLVVVGISGLALAPVLRGARREGGTGFAAVVGGYAAVLAAMSALGIGTGYIPIAIGSALFLVSDTLLARDRFVARTTYGPLAVIVTYHLAQGLILFGLIRSA